MSNEAEVGRKRGGARPNAYLMLPTQKSRTRKAGVDRAGARGPPSRRAACLGRRDGGAEQLKSRKVPPEPSGRARGAARP